MNTCIFKIASTLIILLLNLMLVHCPIEPVFGIAFRIYNFPCHSAAQLRLPHSLAPPRSPRVPTYPTPPKSSPKRWQNQNNHPHSKSQKRYLSLSISKDRRKNAKTEFPNPGIEPGATRIWLRTMKASYVNPYTNSDGIVNVICWKRGRFEKYEG